jgi:hypothetical protein
MEKRMTEKSRRVLDRALIDKGATLRNRKHELDEINSGASWWLPGTFDKELKYIEEELIKIKDARRELEEL